MGEEDGRCQDEVRRDQQTGRDYVHQWYRALKMNLAVVLTATVYLGLIIVFKLFLREGYN